MLLRVFFLEIKKRTKNFGAMAFFQSQRNVIEKQTSIQPIPTRPRISFIRARALPILKIRTSGAAHGHPQ